MANLSLADVNIRHFSLPYMRLLNEEFRENVDLAIVDRDEVLFIDTFESTQPVKLAVSPGQHLPAYNSASGKAILAFLPNEEALRIIKKHNHDIETQNQLKLEAFLEDLRVTRDRGYALDCESLEVGVNAVAAPIFGLKNKPIASLAIAGPAYRLDCELMQKMGEKLIATNLEISKKILQAS
ncbi:MAG: IclR family transcriptional regulator [Brevefilum sp.]